MTKYILTEEGNKYREDGLPEKRLIELLEDGPLEFNEVKNQLNDFSIALQWAKKNSWVEVREGKIYLIKEPDEIKEQDALEKIHKNESADEKIISVLLQRRLIEAERETLAKRAEKFVGKEVTHLTPELIKTGKWRDVTLKPYNVEFVGKKIHPGKRQPYNQFLMNVRRKLVEIGFIEMCGPIIETEFWNFDALFQPQNHPSRDWAQTYSLKNPKYGDLPDKKLVERVRASHEKSWKYRWDAKKAAQLVARAHDTAISPRYLSKGVKIPGKYFSIVRCYRPDVIDATHGVEFNQMGGFVIAEDLNFKHMLGLLKMFATEIAGAQNVKFLPDYYPFTEPSVQVSAKHPKMGWVELAGAGIFREELTKPLGINVPVIAWGFGIDRLAMYKLGINDIRYLFSQDITWLREHAVVR